MDHAIAMGLAGVPIVSEHYDKIRDPVSHRVRKMRGQLPREDPHIMSNRVLEEKGLVLRKRSEVQSDEEIVETVRHKGQVLPRRPRPARQASSMDRGGPDGGRRRRARGGAGAYSSDSEGSVPPRSRVRARSTGGRSRRRPGSNSSSSSSSSDLGSSTDEAKEMRKMQRKKWITAALASVATIHAASKVYSSIENHDKRVEEVKAGKISPEDAHKKQRAARWQDAAAIGIAALGIKGAMSEWHEVQEEHGHHKELIKEHEEKHKKRLEHERRERARAKNGYYKGRDGQWYYDGPELQTSQKYGDEGGSRSKARQIDGPRANDRKMIEGPSGRSRSRYGADRERSKSVYDWDDGSSYDQGRERRRSPSRRRLFDRNVPVRSYPAWTSPTDGPLCQKPIRLSPPSSTSSSQSPPRRLKHTSGYKRDVKDLGFDIAGEALEMI